MADFRCCRMRLRCCRHFAVALPAPLLIAPAADITRRRFFASSADDTPLIFAIFILTPLHYLITAADAAFSVAAGCRAAAAFMLALPCRHADADMMPLYAMLLFCRRFSRHAAATPRRRLFRRHYAAAACCAGYAMLLRYATAADDGCLIAALPLPRRYAAARCCARQRRSATQSAVMIAVCAAAMPPFDAPRTLPFLILPPPCRPSAACCRRRVLAPTRCRRRDALTPRRQTPLPYDCQRRHFTPAAFAAPTFCCCPRQPCHVLPDRLRA